MSGEPGQPPPAAGPPPLPDALVIGASPDAREPRLAAASAPYRPDTVVDGGHADGLVVRAAAVRGRAKRDDAAVREDDVCVAHVPGCEAVVVAVADGMGSAARGHLAAALACRHAVEEAERQLRVCAEPQAIDWPKLFNRAAVALVRAFRDHAGHDERELRDVSQDLGTTLTVAVARRRGAGMSVDVGAIGDSPAWTLHDDDWRVLVGAEQDDEDGFADSRVIALPYLPEPEVWQGELEEGAVLVVATDGFGRPLGNGRNDLGRAMARALREPPPLAVWPYLVDFGRRTYDDDRTIAAIWAIDR